LDRDFSTISTSAKSLILMKGHTSIPYAKKAAELVSFPDGFVPDYQNEDLLYWGRILHFEARYLSIDLSLRDIHAGNILELSSGFSFRCLEQAKEKGVFYIDTDLPDLIEKKREMLKSINNEEELPNLRLLPLNVLDEHEFKRIAQLFPPGELAIVNEGLLMYFDMAEKERLCGIIRDILAARGGYWITSDIYIRTMAQASGGQQAKEWDSFYKAHNIEENKFASFDEARSFFESNGFSIDREEDVDISKLSAFKYLAKTKRTEAETPRKPMQKIQATWRLKIADR
jgi:O-methyltransferase involved in polyketide biosynthesis